MTKLIEVKEVSKVYSSLTGRNPFVAVDKVSLSINRGSIYGLLGLNGAGKTTLVKMICGLVLPTGGSIILDGHDISKNPELSRRRIGAVLEGNRNIHWRLSPLENLYYFGYLRNQSRADITRRGMKLLADLNLLDKKDVLVSKLSRGMQQKVSIAVALISDPEIILLDEPALGLDVEISITIREYLNGLAKQNKAVLLTTHQMDLAQAVCDTVGVIKSGRLVKEIKIGGISKWFSLEKFFLDTVRDEPTNNKGSSQ